MNREDGWTLVDRVLIGVIAVVLTSLAVLGIASLLAGFI
jgi:hypothetical protein